MSIARTLPVPDQDIPGWGTLFWDSYKTTNLGSLNDDMEIGAYIGAACLSPTFLVTFPIFCFLNPSILTNTYYYAGMALTAPITVPVALIEGHLSSLFYAIAAGKRKFRANTDIKPALEAILSFEDELDRQFIINWILEIDKQQQKNDGIRSYESSKLLNILKESSDTQKKWQALNKYMRSESDGVYLNNGKKLFNAILDIADDHNFKTRLELHNAIREHDIEYLRKHRERCNYIMNLPNTRGMNYLHRCVIANEYTETIALIIHNKFVDKNTLVDCHSSEHHGKSALYLAAEYGHNHIVECLIKECAACNINGEFINPMVVAAKHGQLATVTGLLSKNEKLLFGEAGDSALALANQHGHYDVVSYLLELRIKQDPEKAREELRQLHTKLFAKHWINKGWGFFSDGLPNGIEKLQAMMKKHNLGENQFDDISMLTPDDIYKIGFRLIKLSHSFGGQHKYRKDETQECYAFTKNFGNNKVLDSALEKQHVPEFNI